MQERSADPDPVDPIVFVETAIFYRDERVRHVFRKRFQRYDTPLQRVKGSELCPMTVQQDGSTTGLIGNEVPWVRTPPHPTPGPN
jgi:hypothetical protein